MRPCCSDQAADFCLFQAGAFFVFFLLVGLIFLYSLVIRMKPLPLLFELSVGMWLFARAFSLTFWHSPPEESVSNHNYCVAAIFRNVPLYFLTQAAFVVVVQIWGDFKRLNSPLGSARSITRRQHGFLIFFSLNNTVWTIVSSIMGCVNPESFITPQRYRLIIFSLLSLLFIAIGLINSTLFPRVGVLPRTARRLHVFTFFGVITNMLRAFWNLIVQFPQVREVKETSLLHNTLAWPFMYVGLLFSTEIIPIFCYTGLLLMIRRNAQEKLADTQRHSFIEHEAGLLESSDGPKLSSISRVTNSP